MKKVNEGSLNKEIYQAIIHLSSDFSLILNETLETEDVVLQDSSLLKLISEPYQNFFPRGKFEEFIFTIDKEEKPVKEIFSLFTSDQEIFVECKGLKIKGKIIIVGNKRSSLVKRRIDLMEKVPIPALLLDDKGYIVTCNSHYKKLHTQLGLPVKICPSVEAGKELHPVYYIYERMLKELVNTKRDVTKEYRREEVRLVIQGVVDGDHYIIMLKDESFQKRFEQLLTYQQQMQAVSQIAAGVAHELRNPLSVIKGFIQLSKLSNSLTTYYDTIYSEINRMNQIIEDFLSISRKKIDKRYVQPEDLIESMLMIFRSECTLHDVEFTYHIQESSHYLYVNEQMIKQVLINVMRNAIEAYEGQTKNRSFLLTTFIIKESYFIQLKDEGPGIPADLIDKINEPFFTTKDKGTGIGIPLGKQILEEHKGEFIINSEPGKGTVITLQLPLFSYKDNQE
ncbi:two-component system sensor histidine kinase NtrB [Salipaludibacillus aurantiacus]|uniref:histidine kinase n=1 Tax=Salipaludibacillus aurantiacus TaxID=1601833 RepID=A0A1H9RCG5_9BACI|nr:ATP-binding protein [Salipaludibacillus aurantiacus]SER69623.1 Signal transduction histidine kinase [Salipaludibacillus aurantiacus]